jgi:UDP-N-acetylmuramoyl-tripeptide--D-alanyl-D-alanine ligase
MTLATTTTCYPVVHDLDAGMLREIVGGLLTLGQMPPLDGACTPVYRVVTDRRQVQPGDVFWALRGDEGDPADCAHEALLRGATGIVSERRVEPWAGRWTLQVPHSELALWELARWRRKRFTGAAVVVAGSVGKTITGRCIETVLRSRLTGVSFPVAHRSPGGLPLSMLAIDPLDDYAIFELSGVAGQMEAQAKLCAPSIGVLTGLPSGSHRSDASAMLVEQLTSEAWLVLPGDDARLRKIAAATRARLMRFGRRGDCDVVATDVECRRGSLRFRIDRQPFCVPVWGRHSLGAVLASFAVGRIFGLAPEEIAGALSSYDPPPSRCQVSDAGGVTFIDDTYSSEATTVGPALSLLREFDPLGRKVVVLGELAGELDRGGLAAGPLHRELGERVVHAGGADLLVACGPHAAEIAQAAVEAGMPAGDAVACATADAAASVLADELAPGDVVLVKGSQTPAIAQIAAARPKPRLKCVA